ncbi:MAG: ABC transporter ATP-binding protein [Clostridium sp.]|nr:ABC transporter ATP-binding protein [Clostridium sp.]
MPNNPLMTIRRLLSYYKDHKIMFTLGIILVISATIFQVAANGMLSPIVDAVTIDRSLPLLQHYLFIMMGLVVGITASQYIGNLLMARLAQTIIHTIRTELFAKIQRMPIAYHDTQGHGRIMSSFTNDVDLLNQALEQSVAQILTSIIAVVGTFTMMTILSPMLTLAMVLMMVASLFLIRFVAGRSSKFFRSRQSSMADMNSYVEEMVSAQKVVKVFGYEGNAISEYIEINDDLRESASKAAAYGVMLMPLMGNISFIQYAIIAMMGAARVITGAMTLGNITAFLQYTRTVSRPITMVSNQMNSILAAIAGAERIFEMMDGVEEEMAGEVRLNRDCSGDRGLCWMVPDADGKIENIPVKGDIRLKEVDFSYVKGKQILHDVSLFAKPGQRIALVGSTGAGKTTITNLINRFYEIENGTITFDGVDIKRINKLDLRSVMSVVLQDVHLFEGTIADNIRFGRLDATDEEVIEAAKLANADTFIRHLKDGYDTFISNDGSSLSQGERQLLSIARAAIADPVVLILDEATSSIDTRTEKLIESGMHELMEGRTTLVIAHRLSTVRRSNAIIVLENGEIVERGDHQELMEQKGRYYRLNMGTEELG